jgi:FkbM family methyltransferase
MVAFDIGANAGYYTLALSRLVGDAGHVYAFEPVARSVNYLQRHIELNKLRNVTVAQLAISSGHGLLSFDDFRISKDNSYLVPSSSLDEFISAGYPRPDFIKMDIEGAEKMALDGATSVLSERKTTWIIATHSDELNLECRKTMAHFGHHSEDLDPSSHGTGDFLAIPDPEMVSVDSGVRSTTATL